MIVKVNPQKNYTKILNDDISNISNNATIVYIRFTQLHPDFNPTNRIMQEKCMMSAVTYKKAKKELVDNQLLFMERTGGKGANIKYHIGSRVVEKILLKKGKQIF